MFVNMNQTVNVNDKENSGMFSNRGQNMITPVKAGTFFDTFVDPKQKNSSLKTDYNSGKAKFNIFNDNPTQIGKMSIY